jgi:sugar lactone lactonase YvrE
VTDDTPIQDTEPAPLADTGPPEPSQASASEQSAAPLPRRGFHLTARRAFLLLAIALTLILIGLLIYLLWFLGRPQTLVDLPATQGIQPVWQVHGPATGDRPLFDRPMGVAVGRANRIYVTDAGNSRVCVFDSQGRFLYEFGGFGVAKPAPGATATYEPGRLNYPVGIDTDDDGNVYVASLYNDSVEVFDADGAPLRRFPDPQQVTGRGGSGADGLGIAVTDVAVSGERVYATDAYQILVFTLEGELIDQWGRPGVGPGDLDRPNGIAVSADGETVYVSDSNHNRVTAFTPSGDVLWQVGKMSAGISDRAAREIELPRGLTVMPDDSVLVSDSFGFQLVRISPEGTIVARYGKRGLTPGELNFSNDVEVLRGFVVIADRGAGRVQLVRLIN